jgi:hypothetical protein
MKTGVYILITGIASVIIYSFTTFATVKYVDDKHDSVKESLTDIKNAIQSLDDRVFDLVNKKSGD